MVPGTHLWRDHFTHPAGAEGCEDLLGPEFVSGGHFFSAACQLVTTVIGALEAASPPAGAFTKKR